MIEVWMNFLRVLEGLVGHRTGRTRKDCTKRTKGNEGGEERKERRAMQFRIRHHSLITQNKMLFATKTLKLTPTFV